MPTILTHPAVPLAMGLGLGQQVISRRLLAVGILASILPDLDVVAFRFGVAYAHQMGHRGISHSIFFALVLALLAGVVGPWLKASRGIAVGFVFLSAVSHPLLDMITNGGLGVALWWPISDQRLFASWQVIEVSPLRLSRFWGSRGITVLWSELKWVWGPACGLALLLWGGRLSARRSERTNGARKS